MSGNVTSKRIKIKDLLFDTKNMRLAIERIKISKDEKVDSDWCQDQLETNFKSLEVAASILHNGYREAEPLLVCGDVSNPGKYIVKEGNRRLSALRGIAFSEVREREGKKRKAWQNLFEEFPNKFAAFTGDYEIPCLVYIDENEALSDASRMHVGKKMAWGPEEQAQYVFNRVTKDKKTIEDVRRELGRKTKTILNLHNSYAVTQQAIGVGYDRERINYFSLVTVALNSKGIKSYLGLPEDHDRNKKPNSFPVPEDKLDNLRLLFEFIFGTDKDIGVFKDGDANRKIRTLGMYIADKKFLADLKENRNFDEASKKVNLQITTPHDLIKLLQKFYTDLEKNLKTWDGNADEDTEKLTLAIIEDLGQLCETDQLDNENQNENN